MMGRLEPGQEQLFYEFCLDDQIPPSRSKSFFNNLGCISGKISGG